LPKTYLGLRFNLHQSRFDQLTDPTAHALIAGIRQRQGDEAALVAANLLALRRAERVTTGGA
jgi:integrase/recombinase XerD